MTYGTLDGTIAPPPEPPKPAITDWKDDGSHGADHGPATATAPSPPPVPGGHGSGGSGATSVDTPSLKLFASNIDQLIQPLKDAKTTLAGMKVQAGGFAQAYDIHDHLVGPNGLQSSYRTVLDRVIETLTDVKNGVNKMAADYETTEEANTMSADAVTKAMPDLAGDITSITTAGGKLGT
ncbi:hypothetical protein [Pseudonocardia acidicola]|uniref:Excreted virulence factor EspC (Type VII ESX diderm) n=1 Tax=Pseudonocardia acidicola TaxID=2724939 RepID=A0ABX1SDP9_9PSEU|nr:hypothetical protein [Pseudonocardia acidicola]NMH99700.1 hypothetical protein [Pseudonocardia acidicola]